MNKYEQLIEIIKEDYDHATDITADLLETLVFKGILEEDVIDAIIDGSCDCESVIDELLGIANTYSDFNYALDLDLEENN